MRFLKDINILSQGAKIIVDRDLTEYSKNIDFNKLFNSVINKYIGFHPKDIKYELAVKAFTNTFIINWANVKSLYNPEYGLYNYLYAILKNDIVTESIKFNNRNSKYCSINPIDTETDEDSWNRVTMGGESVSRPVTRSMSKWERDSFNDLLRDYDELKKRIIHKELKVDDLDKSLESIDKKIEKIRLEMQKIDGYHQSKVVDNSSFNDIEDTNKLLEDSLNPFMDRLRAKLVNIETSYRGKVNKPWASDRIKFLDLILADFNYSECAIFFEVTPTSTNKWAKQIIDALYELADEMEINEGDDSLVRRLNDWIDDLEGEDKINRNRGEGCPKPKDKAELYKQIISVFGPEFMNIEEV